MADERLDQVTWWELPVGDLEQGKRFYGEVFDWTFQPYDDVEMVFTRDGAMVGALDGARKDVPGRGVSVYVNVADLDGTLARVEAAGGEVVQARTHIGGDMGWWAAFRDPAGLWLGLCTSRPADD